MLLPQKTALQYAGNMRATFSAIYIKTPPSAPTGARPAGPAWSALETDDLPLCDETDYAEDPELCAARGPSARYGEAIYVFEDEGNDQLHYDHCRDGELLRKLVYAFDGCRSSWSCIAGTPEPWEDELFSAASLAHDLQLADGEQRAHVHEIFAGRAILSGSELPRASSASGIEAHFGIVRPQR